MTYAKTKQNNKNVKQCLNNILGYRGQIKILKYKSISNVKKVNNTLYA